MGPGGDYGGFRTQGLSFFIMTFDGVVLIVKYGTTGHLCDLTSRDRGHWFTRCKGSGALVVDEFNSRLSKLFQRWSFRVLGSLGVLSGNECMYQVVSTALRVIFRTLQQRDV